MEQTVLLEPERSTIDSATESVTTASPVAEFEDPADFVDAESGEPLEFPDTLDFGEPVESEEVTSALPYEPVESEDVLATLNVGTTNSTPKTRVLTGCAGVDALLHSHVLSGALVNVDADPGVDAGRLLQSVCRTSARGGKRVVFISVDPGAATLPSSYSPRTAFPNFDSPPPSSPDPLRSFGVPTFREFIATIGDVLEEAPPPDLIVVEGLDYLFQRERPGSGRESVPGDGRGPEVIDPDVLLGEAVARAGHEHLDRWLGLYAGIGRTLKVAIWVSCSHGNDLPPSESRAEAVARAAYYDGLRPLVQARCPYTLRLSDPNEGEGEESSGEGATGELSVALYEARRRSSGALKLGETRMALPDDDEGLSEED